MSETNLHRIDNCLWRCSSHRTGHKLFVECQGLVWVGVEENALISFVGLKLERWFRSDFEAINTVSTPHRSHTAFFEHLLERTDQPCRRGLATSCLVDDLDTVQWGSRRTRYAASNAWNKSYKLWKLNDTKDINVQRFNNIHSGSR